PGSLAQVQGEAMRAIARIASHGRVPLLVGGAGHYIRAITEGWQAPGGEPSAALRAELQTRLAREGVASLAARLTAADPASAAQIDLRNPRRIIRALEVVLTTGQSFIAQRRKSPPPYAITTIGLTLPRAELYARIDARVEAMLASGLVDEVRGLADRGYHWELPAMSALGYRQIGAYLRGECDLAEAVRRIKRDTHVFVRRQANWFKLTDPHIRWFSPHDPVDAVTAYLAARIER
ncbi:MAG: tRNA (adenosine(37)-N6)-dimethylallyltransferase MiaA, partial [Anaerolineales bacterium]